MSLALLGTLLKRVQLISQAILSGCGINRKESNAEVRK
jgi:hypothetical protein